MTICRACSAVMPANAAVHLPAHERVGLAGLVLLQVSPTQTMGIRPWASAALIFLLTPSSVSPKYWRRSRVADDDVAGQPLQHGGRHLAGEGAALGPVHVLRADADLRTPIFAPASASATAGRHTNGGQTTVSHLAIRREHGRSARTNSTASAGVLFIFQLPARMGLRMRMNLLMMNTRSRRDCVYAYYVLRVLHAIVQA